MEAAIDTILQYLAKQQRPDGSFDSFESYPPEHPLGHKNWFFTDPSPFIHANILCALQDIPDPLARSIIRKGCQFIQQQQEWRGLWRFWHHGGTTHNVPIDLDDTALCSYILTRNGFRVHNQRYLLANIDSQGYFLTWLLPHRRLWLYPKLYRFLRRDVRQLRAILASPMLSAMDKEPAVAANVLLYLGETSKTKRCIQQILQQLKHPGEAPLQYYDDPLVIFYHVSRAYRNGVLSFRAAGAAFEQYCDEMPTPTNVFKQAMLATTLLNFEHPDPSRLEPLIQTIKETATSQAMESYIYFVSKDRNFRAGSPELTAALCAEALATYNRRYASAYKA